MPSFKFKIHWRTIQICINIGSAVTGFCAFLPLGYVTKMFTNHCVLYGDIKIESVTDTTVKVDNEKSVWGRTDTCQFAIFTTVIASIHAFFWCWFFLCMKAQLKMERAEFPMLLASFLMHGLAMVVMFISSGVISAGVDTWCGNLAKELDRKSHGKIMYCIEAQNLTWSLIGKQYSFYKFLIISKVSSWLCVVTIMSQFLVCGYKLYAWALQTNVEQRIKNSSNGELLPKANGITIENDDQDDTYDNSANISVYTPAKSDRNHASSGYRKLVVSAETPSSTPPPEMV